MHYLKTKQNKNSRDRGMQLSEPPSDGLEIVVVWLAFVIFTEQCQLPLTSKSFCRVLKLFKVFQLYSAKEKYKDVNKCT